MWRIFLEDELHLNNDNCYHYCCCRQYYCSNLFFKFTLFFIVYALKLHQIGAFNFLFLYISGEHAPDLPKYSVSKVHKP